ncbi:transglycosylase-associated protein [Brevundimonas abyssalis TAR-001]|uniref:Transglycosylase-associated protein n=1 Tax=Brevundimonas abyssalis TAR-001 TaxID=1391729 RepID=A0A8E0TRZ0_9CAUL|nr:transglycosylase-associated protein [Brevundimonas abyssalis TAR-001]
MGGMGWIAWIIIGIIAGWLAEQIMGRNHGLLTNLIVGVIGALIGGFVANALASPGAAGSARPSWPRSARSSCCSFWAS